MLTIALGGLALFVLYRLIWRYRENARRQRDRESWLRYHEREEQLWRDPPKVEGPLEFGPVGYGPDRQAYDWLKTHESTVVKVERWVGPFPDPRKWNPPQTPIETEWLVNRPRVMKSSGESGNFAGG
jgi:hypothetical protein